MRVLVAVMACVLLCGGCDGKGSAQGSASENGARGHLKIALPF